VSVRDRGEFELEQTIAPDGVVRLAVIGELDLPVADALSVRLSELKRSGERVRLDLSRLRFIDSSGIRVVLIAVSDARRDGWELEVGRELTGQVRRVIKTLGVASALWPAQ
jgi:anti-sigma B factor antagonist